MSQFPEPEPKLKKQGVLDEDEYLDKMSQIIKQNYFPELQKIQNFYKLQDPQNRYKKQEDIIREFIEQDLNPQNKITLNQYLNNYTSEDNQAFSNLMEKEREKFRQKYWWVFDQEKQCKEKQLALTYENKLNNMLEGTKQNNLQFSEYKALTNFIFQPDSQVTTLQQYCTSQMESSKKVLPENTRFTTEQLEYLTNIKIEENKQIRLYGEKHGLQTPDLFGLKRKIHDEKFELDSETGQIKKVLKEQLFNPQNQKIQGYSLLQLPSPNPNNQTPLMTWGEIEETPIRIGRGYQIPEINKKEKIQDQIVNQLLKKKKIHQKQKEERQIKQLLSNTPAIRSSSILLKNKNDDESLLGQFLKRPSSIFSQSSSISRINTPSSINKKQLSITKAKKVISNAQNQQQKEDKKAVLTDGLLKI